MSDEQPATADSGGVRSPLTRRAILKVAALASLLTEPAGATTETGQAPNEPQGPAGAGPASIAAADRITTVDGDVGRYAAAVALDDETALVGVPPAAALDGPAVGRVEVLTRTGDAWRPDATLEPAGESGQFGRTVALDGDTAVVGGELGPDPTGDHAGSATVFARDGDEWRRQATLRGPDSGAVDLFGTAVAVAGDTVLVGASAASTRDGQAPGAAFVYTRAGERWRETARLSPGTGIEEFGRSVAISGETAVVGGRKPGARGSPGTGVASVFERHGTTWRHTATLKPRRRGRETDFGAAVALAGRTIIVGAPAESNALGMNAGGAAVFTRHRGRWRREATLQSSDGGAYDQFGSAVTLDGDVTLVGSKAGGGPFAFIRTAGAWRQVRSLGEDDTDRTEAGTVVAVDGARAVVSVVASDAAGDQQTGAVEIFEP